MVAGGKSHDPVRLPPGKRPGVHLAEASLAIGSVWTDAKSFASIGIRSSDRASHRESKHLQF